eukprot:Tbor_TRINITY_DN718_c0_g1::TRINITY_DN718_c0_g1_i1::g.3371::m.3371
MDQFLGNMKGLVGSPKETKKNTQLQEDKIEALERKVETLQAVSKQYESDLYQEKESHEAFKSKVAIWKEKVKAVSTQEREELELMKQELEHVTQELEIYKEIQRRQQTDNDGGVDDVASKENIVLITKEVHNCVDAVLGEYRDKNKAQVNKLMTELDTALERSKIAEGKLKDLKEENLRLNELCLKTQENMRLELEDNERKYETE